MPLMPLDTIVPALRSPCCRAGLDERWCCRRCAREFDVVDGRPVLVDFDSSVLSGTAIRHSRAASPVHRRRRGRRSQRLVAYRNPVIRREIDALLGAVRRRPRVLVVGGATIAAGTGTLYARADVVAVDIYASRHVQVVADAHRLPFQDGWFDAVVVTAVLEHVLSPHDVAEEIWRVVAPSGRVYAETPFLQGVHEGAYDFARFTQSGHRWLFRGFDEVAAGSIGGPFLSLVWAAESAARALTRSALAGVLTRMLLKPLVLLDRLVPQGARSDFAVAVYFHGCRRDEPICPREVITGYAGDQRQPGDRARRTARPADRPATTPGP